MVYLYMHLLVLLVTCDSNEYNFTGGNVWVETIGWHGSVSQNPTNISKAPAIACGDNVSGIVAYQREHKGNNIFPLCISSSPCCSKTTTNHIEQHACAGREVTNTSISYHQRSPSGVTRGSNILPSLEGFQWSTVEARCS